MLTPRIDRLGLSLFLALWWGAALQAPIAAASDWEDVDDLTAYNRATSQFVERHSPPQSQAQVAADRGAAALDEGIVGCSTSDAANAFELGSHATTTSIDLLPEGNYPYDATMNFAGTQVWIPGASGDGVIVIDRASNAVAERITVGDYPISAVFTQDGSRALISNRSTRDVSVVSTATYIVIDTLDFGLTSGFGPGNMALDPTTGHIWAVRWYDSDLYEIAADGSAVLNTYPIGDSLWQLVVAPDGQAVYVTDRGTDALLVVDPASGLVVDSVSVGDDPWGLDITADGALAVVTCEDDQTVHIVDTPTMAVTPVALSAGADARDVDILDDTGVAYVTGGTITGSSPIYAIDLESATIVDQFAALDTNTNVIAVQSQMGGGTTAVALSPGPAAPPPSMMAAPNPFNPHTEVRFGLAEAGRVLVAVYDAGGAWVANLVDGYRAAGEHRVPWDGRGASGVARPGGVYFVHLQAATASQTLKVVLAK